MASIKVGDRARCLRENWGRYGFEYNKIYTIVDLSYIENECSALFNNGHRARLPRPSCWEILTRETLSDVLGDITKLSRFLKRECDHG